MTLARWTSTVRGLIPSSRAIILLVYPAMSQSSTSRSRGDRMAICCLDHAAELSAEETADTDDKAEVTAAKSASRLHGASTTSAAPAFIALTATV